MDTKKQQSRQQVNITYETLFDILRVEKGRDEIQQLSPAFFYDVVTYLQQKRELLKKREHESGVDNFDEVKKIRIQYENVQRLIKEIYQRREKKILMLALNCSRTKGSIISDEYFLETEKIFFGKIKRVLDENRKNNLNTLLEGKMPPSCHIEQQTRQGIPPIQTEEQQAATDSLQIRFLKNVGQFIGPELETYGPFTPNSTAHVPEKIAEILMVDGKAEKV